MQQSECNSMWLLWEAVPSYWVAAAGRDAPGPFAFTQPWCSGIKPTRSQGWKGERKPYWKCKMGQGDRALQLLALLPRLTPVPASLPSAHWGWVTSAVRAPHQYSQCSPPVQTMFSHQYSQCS